MHLPTLPLEEIRTEVTD